jgi:formate transporter
VSLPIDNDPTPDTGPPARSASMHPMAGVDSFSPSEIAGLVETKGVAKAEASFLTTLVLAIVAGAFIALGGVFSTVVSTGSTLGEGPTRLLAGLAFSLGLILVVVAGAELFTGNNLVVMSWVSRRVTLGRMLRNWAIVYAGNAVGALSVVFLAYAADWWAVAGNSVGANALTIAASKSSLSFEVAFVRGILANALVCLAVWLATAGRSLTDKVVAIVFPITAFVAAGFEHSIANMYFIPMGLLLSRQPDVVETAALPAERLASLGAAGLISNIGAATLGNVIGGAGLVGLVYWFVYLRPKPSADRTR